MGYHFTFWKEAKYLESPYQLSFRRAKFNPTKFKYVRVRFKFCKLKPMSKQYVNIDLCSFDNGLKQLCVVPISIDEMVGAR